MSIENPFEQKIESGENVSPDDSIKWEKTSEEAIKEILEKENLTGIDEESIKTQLEENKRHIRLTGEKEGEEKFLKIFNREAVPGEEVENEQAGFKREKIVNDFLKEKGIPIRNIESSNLEPGKGELYSVYEALPETGLIKTPEDFKKLTEAHAKNFIENLVKIHEIKEIPDNVKETLRRPEELKGVANFEEYSKKINEFLNLQLSPVGHREKGLLNKRIERNLNTEGLNEKAQELLEKYKEKIENEQGKQDVLVHGDLHPFNLYAGENGETTTLDWEHAAKGENKLIAMAHDYGHLRERVWNNEEFKEALDKAVIEHFKEQGDEETGRAIVSLGILRWTVGLGRYFENYPYDKQEQEMENYKGHTHKERIDATEKDLRKAFETAGVEL